MYKIDNASLFEELHHPIRLLNNALRKKTQVVLLPGTFQRDVFILTSGGWNGSEHSADILCLKLLTKGPNKKKDSWHHLVWCANAYTML